MKAGELNTPSCGTSSRHTRGSQATPSLCLCTCILSLVSTCPPTSLSFFGGRHFPLNHPSRYGLILWRRRNRHAWFSILDRVECPRRSSAPAPLGSTLTSAEERGEENTNKMMRLCRGILRIRLIHESVSHGHISLTLSGSECHRRKFIRPAAFANTARSASATSLPPTKPSQTPVLHILPQSKLHQLPQPPLQCCTI